MTLGESNQPLEPPDFRERGGTAQRRTVICFALIVTLAFGVRLIHLYQAAKLPTFNTPINDARSYVEWSKRIAAGDWIGREVFYQAPLYPYFLAAVRLIVSPDLWVTRILQIALGSCACGLLYLAGRRLFSQTAGLIAGLIAALYAPNIFFDGLLQKAVIDMFFMCLLLCLWARASRTPSGTISLLAGVVLGCFCLTRENVILFAPVIGLGLLLPRAALTHSRRAASLGLFVIGVGLVLVPVGLRNRHIGGSFLMTTAQMGPNFYIGNHEGATGCYGPLRPDRDDPAYERTDAVDLAQETLGRKLSPAEVSDYWLAKALDWIRGHPGDWLSLTGKKCLWLMNAYEVPDAEDFYYYTANCSVVRSLSLIFHFGVLAPMGILGIALTWRRRRDLWVVYVLLGILGMSTVLFFIAARYRVPMIPILILFASAGIVESVRRVRLASVRSLGMAGLGAAVAAVPINWRLIDPASHVAMAHTNAGSALFLAGKLDAAIDEFQAAVRINPNATGAHINLGNTYGKKGMLPDSIRCLRQALALRPGDLEIGLDLGNVLGESGELAEAEPLIRAALPIAARRPDVYSSLGVILLRLKRWSEAIEVLRRGADEAPNQLSILSNLAWSLATCPQDDLRDGHYALSLAETCLRKTGFKDPRAFDIVAAALAEVGRFDDAVAAEQRALKLAAGRSNPKDMAEFEARLRLYQEEKPYRRQN